MKKQQASLMLILVAAALPAQAATKPTSPITAHGKVIFSCTTTNHKPVLVTEYNNRFRYQFGKAAHPELVFEDDKKAAIARSPLWAGVGRHIWSNLVLQNGDYYYTVYTATDRLTDEHPTEEGVTVSKATTAHYDEATYVTNLRCDPNKAIVVNFPEALLF